MSSISSLGLHDQDQVYRTPFTHERATTHVLMKIIFVECHNYYSIPQILDISCAVCAPGFVAGVSTCTCHEIMTGHEMKPRCRYY